jgi:4-hydroxyphenylacetate 3-monooxygenase
MVMGIEVFRRNGSDRADAMLNYFEYVRDNDLFVTYVIQNPQSDKTRTPSGVERDFVAQIVDEDATGITVRGAKMLGTSTVMADELFVGNIQPLKPGEERYAMSFAVPIGTAGLKLMSRRSYEGAASSTFDYPLSSNFDENDAVVYFDDVKVPWERVFLKGDVDAVRAQWSETPAHVYQNYQSLIRLSVKLQFLIGLARRIAETNGAADIPQIRGTLGHLAAQSAVIEGLVAGMEAAGQNVGPYYVPSAKLVYAALTLSQEMYPRIVHEIRDLAGGGLIMLPSSVADLATPETASIIQATQVSPATDAIGRIKIFKLAWDALGSEFGSRHLQYEMFYAGASYVNFGNMYRNYDWGRSAELVDRALSYMGNPAVAPQLSEAAE